MGIDITDLDKEDWTEKIELWLKEYFPNIKICNDCNRPFTRYFIIKFPLYVNWNIMEVKNMTKEQFKEFVEKRVCDKNYWDNIVLEVK